MYRVAIICLLSTVLLVSCADLQLQSSARQVIPQTVADPVEPDESAVAEKFLGVWKGDWTRNEYAVLTVLLVSPDGTVEGTYESVYDSGNTKTPFVVTINDGVLELVDENNKPWLKFFFSTTGRMQADYYSSSGNGGDSPSSSITLTRMGLPQPAAVLAAKYVGLWEGDINKGLGVALLVWSATDDGQVQGIYEYTRKRTESIIPFKAHINNKGDMIVQLNERLLLAFFFDNNSQPRVRYFRNRKAIHDVVVNRLTPFSAPRSDQIPKRMARYWGDWKINWKPNEYAVLTILSVSANGQVQGSYEHIHTRSKTRTSFTTALSNNGVLSLLRDDNSVWLEFSVDAEGKMEARLFENGQPQSKFFMTRFELQQS